MQRRKMFTRNLRSGSIRFQTMMLFNLWYIDGSLQSITITTQQNVLFFCLKAKVRNVVIALSTKLITKRIF